MAKDIVKTALLICLLCVGMVDMSVSASTTSTTFEDVWQRYESDEQFQLMIKDYGEEYAVEFVEDVIKNENLTAKTRGGGGNVCYQYVTNVKQTKTYNCGSTTVLQTLYGLGSTNKVSGSSDADKIAFIDSKYDVDSQGSLFVYQVTDALNAYKPNGIGNYTYTVGTSLTENQFEGAIATSLTSCKPIVLHAKTEYLSYYQGKSLGHYLSLDYVNRTERVVRIVDCNYNDSYYGIHRNVPISEAYNTIAKTNSRYLIY